MLPTQAGRLAAGHVIAAGRLRARHAIAFGYNRHDRATERPAAQLNFISSHIAAPSYKTWFRSFGFTLKYYLFEGDSLLRASRVLAPCGEELGRSESPTFWEVSKGIAIVPYLDEEQDIVNECELTDLIPVFLEVMVVSNLLACLTEFQADPQIEHLPIELSNRAGKQLSRSYTLPYSRTWHNSIDVLASQATLFDDGAVDEIEQWVFNRKEIPPFDWWYAHDYTWVVSQRVRDAVQAKRFSNVKFTEIAVA